MQMIGRSSGRVASPPPLCLLRAPGFRFWGLSCVSWMSLWMNPPDYMRAEEVVNM